ncbi:LOW QUALITY PROTEIN: hypothetical protein ACG7TL_001564 [Trametes sanguinea]
MHLVRARPNLGGALAGSTEARLESMKLFTMRGPEQPIAFAGLFRAVGTYSTVYYKQTSGPGTSRKSVSPSTVASLMSSRAAASDASCDPIRTGAKAGTPNTMASPAALHAYAHPLLAAFRASTPAFGAWLTLPGFLAARTAAAASPHLSWVVIDCEHGATPLQPGAAESVHAIAGLGPAAPSTIVRIPATGACADGSAGWQIKYALDAGARGVLVPMAPLQCLHDNCHTNRAGARQVSTRAQAASVVAAARFPPAGIRGFGSPFTQQAWGPGVSAADYLARANDAVLVLVQIETRAGVENLEDILAVDGLDGVFIGPYDLSLSLGFPAPAPDPHPEVEVVIKRILAAAHDTGKKCAIFCTSGTQAAQRAKEGFDMASAGARGSGLGVAAETLTGWINVTSDSGAMAESIARNLADAAGVGQGAKGFSY